MKILLKISIVSVLILTGLNMRAQELVSTAGNLYSDDQLMVSWTIGEPVIETFTGVNYVLTQGFQQSGIALVGAEDFDNQYANIRVYPNPTSDYVKLELNDDKENLSYRLVNSSGKVIANKLITEKTLRISFKNEESGLYLIHLMEGKQTMKIFRIVKN